VSPAFFLTFSFFSDAPSQKSTPPLFPFAARPGPFYLRAARFFLNFILSGSPTIQRHGVPEKLSTPLLPLYSNPFPVEPILSSWALKSAIVNAAIGALHSCFLSRPCHDLHCPLPAVLSSWHPSAVEAQQGGGPPPRRRGATSPQLVLFPFLLAFSVLSSFLFLFSRPPGTLLLLWK